MNVRATGYAEGACGGTILHSLHHRRKLSSPHWQAWSPEFTLGSQPWNRVEGRNIPCVPKRVERDGSDDYISVVRSATSWQEGCGGPEEKEVSCVSLSVEAATV